MDTKKLISDILSGNTRDLRKRADLGLRKVRRIVYNFSHGEKSLDELRNIPVIINNRNRLSYLKMLLSWLDNNGMKNILILDNDSTYGPLLHFYNEGRYKVEYLKKNGGPRALWETANLKDHLRDFYIYTDSDVVPCETCSFRSIEIMYNALKENMKIEKIGLGLRVDDLPSTFRLKNEVIKWEEQFWMKRIDNTFFSAPVDTTFALYAPFAQGGGECKAYRTNFPHVAMHMPWYEDSLNPKPEDEFYRAHAAAQNSHWTELTKTN